MLILHLNPGTKQRSLPQLHPTTIQPYYEFITIEGKIIAVLGITGTQVRIQQWMLKIPSTDIRGQGSSVANHFLQNKDWLIRGITRNPSSTKAKVWASKDVEIVQADQNDVNSLKRAFRGAHAIFAVTDFASNWTKVSESATLRDKASEAGKSIGEYAGELERVQGVNAATAAADPDTIATLERFVFSTLAPVKKISGGRTHGNLIPRPVWCSISARNCHNSPSA